MVCRCVVLTSCFLIVNTVDDGSSATNCCDVDVVTFFVDISKFVTIVFGIRVALVYVVAYAATLHFGLHLL